MSLKQLKTRCKNRVFYYNKVIYICLMAARDETNRFYEDLKRDFIKFSSVKEFGVQKYTTDWILAKLGNKYYKSPKTIENIVFNRVAYATPQLSMFNQ